MQPENTKYFSVDMFCDLSNLLISAQERKLIPVMGGDLNCRYGDLNLSFGKYNICYTDKVDAISNNHGRSYGSDLCNIGGVFPLNHSRFRKKIFPGYYTYLKAGKKSQIDYVYTQIKKGYGS